MAPPEENAADEFIRIFKDQIRNTLALRLPDRCFERGREAELEERVAVIVDQRISIDKLPVGQNLPANLIESILADIASTQN